ncbi:mechanosensitive ion channel family protein [Accumulibacter sp.]|uniref:mechanosensitive ion channel family protein n=1 Tax=Accumulibacter sp. TaxID=2053492 RepID=UPI0028C488AB|nr:mechanosensitive ion channel family protein [Accumulibacter sp.]
MQRIMNEMLAHFWLPETKYIIFVVSILALLLLRLLPKERRRVANTVALFVVCLAGQILGALLQALDYARVAVMVHEIFVIGSGMAMFRLVALFIFRVILQRLGIIVARIAEDIIILIVYAAFILARLHLVGLDPSSLLTTSAVLTAVLAFAMQDTLGNLLSGVALQLDNSLRAGDWIKLDEISGRVLQTRWRQTTIRTRNGEVIVVPNSQLMKGKFTLFGRADVAMWPWRRWVWFNVTYASAPAAVIQKVEKAINGAEIPNVLREPLATCVLMDFGPGYGHYALRYWALDPQPDDPTDSAVRVHIFAALQRAGMQLAVPEQALHVTKENDRYRESVHRREIERRIADLRKVELFAGLQDDELRTISERLAHAPFARGDVIFQQGDAPQWLYLLAVGEAEVWMDLPEHPRQLFRTIHAGGTFGEKGVLTGEARRATITAKTDVVCYRLDQATLEEVIRSRPEIAEAIAEILARREAQMDEFHNQFLDAQADRPASQPKAGMLKLMRSFLGF